MFFELKQNKYFLNNRRLPEFMEKDKQFLLLSLDDKRISKVAEVISKKTSRGILKLLSEKAMTESEISEKLGIPLSTVHYNIQRLLDAGLIEAQEYHYSKKGREINHYSVSKQYVIFAHKIEENSLVKEFSKILTAALVSFGALKLINYMNLILLSRTSQNLKQVFVEKVGSEEGILSKTASASPNVPKMTQSANEFLIFTALLILFYILISIFLKRINFRKVFKR